MWSATDPQRAARLARESELVIVFANQWTAESIDASLTLPDHQDDLIEAVASANPHTVIVLETGGRTRRLNADQPFQIALQTDQPTRAALHLRVLDGGEPVKNVRDEVSLAGALAKVAGLEPGGTVTPL